MMVVHALLALRYWLPIPKHCFQVASLKISLAKMIAHTWWRHQMETISVLLTLCEGIHRSPMDSPHKGQWREAFVFFAALEQTVKSRRRWFERPSRLLWRPVMPCPIIIFKSLIWRSAYLEMISHSYQSWDLLQQQGSFCLCAQPMRDDVTM